MEADVIGPGWLNYLHLQRFYAIAREGGVTAAARREHVSASTLSQQLQELEDWLGHPLFQRSKGRMVLTEEGRVALQYAEEIFATGRELLSRFRRGEGRREPVLRIGAVGPLSKNLQFDFIQPLLQGAGARLLVLAGPFETLVRRLKEHELDVVLSNMPARTTEGEGVQLHNHLLGEMPVYLTGGRRVPQGGAPFPQWLEGQPLFLPTRQSLVREEFDLILAEAGVRPDIRAEVDDMALLRLLALSGAGLALVPAIVVKHELGSRRLPTRFRVPGLAERFHAITLRRRFAHPLLERTIPRLRETLEAVGQWGRPSAAPASRARARARKVLKPARGRSDPSGPD